MECIELTKLNVYNSEVGSMVTKVLGDNKKREYCETFHWIYYLRRTITRTLNVSFK